MSNTKHILCLFILCLFFSHNFYANLSGYGFHKVISIQSSKVVGLANHIDFPVLINHIDTDLRSVGNGGNVENINGYDIRFTAADGSTLLDHQLEDYDPITGSITAWVRIPVLSALTNTDIRIYYGNTSISVDSSVPTVWDANYQGVWHLSDNDLDGTSNTNNLSASTTSNETNSIIADGQRLTFGERMTSGVQTELQIKGDITVEAWVNFNTIQSGIADNTVIGCGLPNLSANENHLYKLNITDANYLRVFWEYASGSGEQVISSVPAAIVPGVWNHLAFTRNDATNLVTFYFNGTQLGLPVLYTNDPGGGSLAEFFLGENFPGFDLDGSVDEARVSDVERSPEWIETQYNSMSNPSTFYTMSTQSANPVWSWMDGSVINGKIQGYSIAVDSANQFVYVVGSFDNETAFSMLPPGQINNGTGNGKLDGFLLKYDFAGALQWMVNMGSNGDDEALGVCVGPAGNIYVTGYFENGMRFFSASGASVSSLVSGGGDDMFTACYNPAGAYQWSKSGTSANGVAGHEIESNSSGLYVVGHYTNSATFGIYTTETTFNNKTGNYLLKYDFAGNELWMVEMKSNGDDYDSGKKWNEYKLDLTTEKDSIYVVGEFKGNILRFTDISGSLLATPQLNNADGSMNVFYGVYDSNGSLGWMNQIESNDNGNLGFGIAVDCDGVYLTGLLHDGAIFPNTNLTTGEHDNTFIAQMDKNNGNDNWIVTLGGTNHDSDIGQDIIADGYGNIIVVGQYKSDPFHTPSTNITGAAGSELFVSCFDNTGLFQWTEVSTGSNDDKGVGIANYGKDNVFIVGSYEQTVNLPPFNSVSGTNDNLLVAGLTTNNSGSLLTCNTCLGPTITICENDTTIYAGPTCDITLGDFTGGITYVGGCGVVTVTQNPAIGSIIPAGTDTVWLYATDANSNVDSCSFTLNIVDSIDPVITCPSNVTVSCPGVVNGIAPINSNDNCAIDSVSYVLTGATVGSGLNDASGTNFNVGITTVTYTVTDSSGNTSSCNFTVTVNDAINPTISCPGNVNATCPTIINGIAPTASGDNCGVDSISYVLTGATIGSGLNDASGTFFNQGITTVTYTITDLSGNTATCNFTVTVNDAINPTISCPGNVNATCPTIINGIAPTASGDNCGVDSISYVLTGATIGSGLNDASGTFFNQGITTVTYTITDLSGNTATCNFTVTVNDAINPTISCPSNVTISCPGVVNGIAPINPNDNCAIDSVSYVLTGATVGSGLNDASGTNFNVGITTVTYTITDLSGNTSSCNFTVTVNDAINPTISCPGNVNATCPTIINGIAPTASGDNCGVDSISYVLTGATIGSGLNDASGTFFNQGITTVTYTITDLSGNTSSCNFTVTVNDAINPTISCPSNVTISCPGVVNGIAPINPNDNCAIDSVSYVLTGATVGSGLNDASGTNFNVGITTVTYTVTDSSGNTSSCNFTVTVNDVINPTISCPVSLVVNSGPGLCSRVINGIAPINPNDNCGIDSVSYVLTGATNGNGLNDASGTNFNVGVTTITYYVYDLSGNVDSCSFTVTVNDTEAPIISCPSNQTVSNDAGVCSAVVSAIGPINISDNCGIDSVSYVLTGATNGNGLNDASGISFNVGVTSLTYIVYDMSGNVDSCTFTITVNDNELPSINCPAPIVICDTFVTVPLPNFSDNCKVDSIYNDFNGTIDATGIYPYGITTVNWTIIDSSGNINTCSTTIEVEKEPIAYAGEDQILYGVNSTYFTATGIGTWSIISGYGNILNTNNPTSYIDALEPGQNVFEWTVKGNVCPDAYDDVMISYYELKIPNGFSPNGDGDNDYFEIKGIDLLENEVVIFNRWGVELYTSKNYQNDWDGRSKDGKDLPEDTYFYIVKIPGLNKELSGYLVLKR